METIDRRGRGERADAIETDARPLEAAFFQHPARSRVAHACAARHRVVAEIAKGVIDHGAHGFGGVALAPEWNAEPIADLRRFLAEARDPATADAVPPRVAIKNTISPSDAFAAVMKLCASASP
jgi:hypothetical protein